MPISNSQIDYKQLRLNMNADIVAKDKEGNIILLVDVRVRTMHPGAATQISESLQAANGQVPFAMLVNPEEMLFFKWASEPLPSPALRLKTVDVMRAYEPEFESKQIFETYLMSLTEAWLRDLAYHWRSLHPPEWERVKALGLLEKLQDGTTEEI